MATAESIALRREAAKERINAAIERIVSDTGANIEPRPAPSKYPDIEPAIQDEWLAGALEVIAQAVESPAAA